MCTTAGDTDGDVAGFLYNSISVVMADSASSAQQKGVIRGWTVCPDRPTYRNTNRFDENTIDDGTTWGNILPPLDLD